MTAFTYVTVSYCYVDVGYWRVGYADGSYWLVRYCGVGYGYVGGSYSAVAYGAVWCPEM